jgi:hypothetical protein
MTSNQLAIPPYSWLLIQKYPVDETNPQLFSNYNLVYSYLKVLQNDRNSDYKFQLYVWSDQRWSPYEAIDIKRGKMNIYSCWLSSTKSIALDANKQHINSLLQAFRRNQLGLD